MQQLSVNIDAGCFTVFPENYCRNFISPGMIDASFSGLFISSAKPNFLGLLCSGRDSDRDKLKLGRSFLFSF